MNKCTEKQYHPLSSTTIIYGYYLSEDDIGNIDSDILDDSDGIVVAMTGGGGVYYFLGIELTKEEEKTDLIQEVPKITQDILDTFNKAIAQAAIDVPELLTIVDRLTSPKIYVFTSFDD